MSMTNMRVENRCNGKVVKDIFPGQSQNSRGMAELENLGIRCINAVIH